MNESADSVPPTNIAAKVAVHGSKAAAMAAKKLVSARKKTLKNLKTKDTGKKVDAMRYCLQDELFLQESEVLPLIIGFLSRIKAPELVMETLKLLDMLISEPVLDSVAFAVEVQDSGEGVKVEVHPEQNAQFIIEQSVASDSSWKGGEPFVALLAVNSLSVDIKTQAIHVYWKLLQKSVALVSKKGSFKDVLSCLQTAGTPCIALLRALDTDHSDLQYAALSCLVTLFETQVDKNFLENEANQQATARIFKFAANAEPRFHQPMLAIIECFSLFALGRSFLKTFDSSTVLKSMITEIADASSNASANAVSPEDATRVNANVCAISRSFCRVEFTKAQLSNPKTIDATLNEASVFPVIGAMITLLERDVTAALSPAPFLPIAGAPGQPASATAASTAIPVAPANAPVFSSEKCVAIISSLGRMMQFSDKCKAWAKDKGVMPILLDCFKIVDQRKLYQVADKLLHLCVLLPEEDESKTARIDPRVLGIIHEDRSAVDTINASAGASSIAAKRAPFVGLDVLLSLLETSSTAEDKVVLFRLIRWLASLVDSPENAIGLGESGVSILLRIVIETFQEHCLLIGYLAKCIRAGTSQSAAACELCGLENRDPTATFVSFIQTLRVNSEKVGYQAWRCDKLAGNEASMCKLEWLDEDEEEHIYGPADVVESRHDIDPYLCAVEALDTLVLGYSKWNIPNPDTSSAAVPASDFSELIAQRMESELSALNNITAVGKPGIAAASKKKIDVSKPAVIGEGVACSVLEKSIELVQLAPSLSDKFPLVSNAVLQLLVHLMRLPGGIKAMLYLAKAGVTPGSKPLGEGSEKIVETRPSSTCPMLTLSTHFSAWPLSSEQSQRTQHALLLKPFLYVLESVYTTFSEVDSAAEALDVLTSGDDINTAVVYTHSATIGSTTIELPISQSDVFVNVAASIGALVRVISFADDSRMADCPSNPTQRLKLADKVESLALRLINFGREKQDVAIAKYKHLSEAADTNQTSPSTGAASSSPSEYVNISTMKLPEFPYMAQWAKAILNLQVDVLRFAYENYSAILLATELSNNKLALALLAAGASPDAASVDGTMPLMTALLTGNDELVRELLCFGANVDTMTVDGNDISVWSCALVSPLGQNVNQMISSAYEIKCAAQGMSLLMELDTVWGSPTFLASCLATKQLDVNVSNVDGNFLLHAIISKLLVRRQIRGLDVCMRYHSQKMERIFLLETVTALLETHGADANACNRLGQTPLHLALKFGHTEIAQCLLRHGANPNTQDSYGYLPLHYACLGFCASEVKQSTGSTLPNPLEILDEILASASKFELVAGKHSDLRKHKLPYEKNALAIETILEDGFVDATSPKAITTKVASVQQILTTAGFSDGLLPWHFACGGCSQVTSTICLDDDMRARFQSNGAARAAILTYFKQKHGADLREKANKNMTALHFALKTNISGCNADVVDVLLDSANCREQINDVHDHSTIDTLPPIPEGSQVDVLTANLHAIHCSVSSRSFDSKYHIILPNGDHLEDLQREQVQPSDRNSSVPAACGVKTKYLLLMESAFSPLHYALQSSDDMALRLLSFSDLSLDPDGSDLPLLALACVARRSAEVVSKLITQQVNMRVHLPLLGAQRDVIANQIAICNLASRKNAAALHFAVLYEDVDVVRVLVENKEVTNVNVRRSGDGFTPLHLACEMSHMELIKLLLDHGANLLQMSTLSSSANGVTPLQLLLKNDTPGNEQLKSLVAAKYLRREMLIEDLGTPLLTHRSSPGTARGESMVREPSYTDLDVDGSSIDADGDGIALSTKSKEQGITCMLLAIEEHNLSLYTRLSQLRENQREGQALGRRLLKDLEKSDDALHVLFQLFVDEPKLPPSFSAAQVTVLEERNANDVHSARQQLPLRTVSFESIEHRHECYRQKIVRSKWIPPRPPTVMRRVSSMNAEVSPPKRKLSNSETPPENPSGPASAQST